MHEQQKAYAKSLVQEAMFLEKEDPEQAQRHYLESADIFLRLSNIDKVNEEKFLRAAELFCLRAKQLKQRKVKTQIIPLNPTLEGKKEGITFEDVVGMESVKEQLQLLIIEPFKHPELYEYYNKPLKGGIVMYGPPGCGKSLMAEAVAQEAGLQFFHVKPSDIMSKFVGETEKNLAALFEKAREQASLIFFDEFEVLGGDRNNATEHTKEIISQLLTEMDGLGTKDQKIFCIAATNEPWNIDIALLREGRFGSTVFIPPPDQEARKAMFEHHLKNRPITEVNYSLLSEHTKNWSGADIKGAIEKAVTEVIKKSIEADEKFDIAHENLLHGIENTRSHTKTWFKKAKEQLEQRHESDRFPEVSEFKNN